jgi:peptide-methionine (R)-S-oxide reductase
MSYPVSKDDDQWLQELGPERFAILRQAGTERAWTGELLGEKRPGIFRCAGCGLELFDQATKFESGSGWPSFWDPVTSDAVKIHEDQSFGMVRLEVVCAACGSHLGHVFPDGVGTPTGQRYCMNSLSLTFDPAETSD